VNRAQAPAPKGALAGTGRAIVRLLEVLLVVCLVTMIAMVFGNVVLRYGFNSGLVLSEELSRFAFVWMTFVGAILAAREGMHVGVDALLVALPEWARRLCLVVAEMMVIACCAVFVWGTWRQHEVNATTQAAVSGLPLIWVFGVGYLTGAGIAFISLQRIVHLLRGGPLERETAPEEAA
jgi:TRAP-type C4-dicarboxylate transport system permease small subunit